MSDLLDRLRAALTDRYTVEREIGRGGMATVFLAGDLKHGRKVAIKTLHPDLAQVVGTDRFLREIDLVAGLTHPHILPLHDSGEANGILYFVMPFIEGETLAERLGREKQLPLDDVLRITREVALALDCAHDSGVIHRDIKPGNILFSSGEAVVADFGIGKAVHSVAGDDLTEVGLVAGTPVYMSPEQAEGERDIDGRSDTYSLACVTYEMLAGEPPFDGPTPQAIRARRAAGEVPGLVTIRNSVPPAMEAVVLKALSRTPADRYSTTGEFASALEDSAHQAAGQSRKRTRIGSVAIAVAVIAAIWHFGFGGLPGTVKPAAAGFFNERDRVLVTEFENGTGDPALGLALRQAVITDLDQSEYVRVVGDETLRRALARMQLPDTARVDVTTGLDIARRQAYPAVVSGGVIPVGSGYQLSAQIIETGTGEVAVRVREAANGEADLLDAFEALSRSLRRHLGESLLSIRRSKPLPEVTTASLEALELYALGLEFSRVGEIDAAMPLFERAVSLDSSFAAAHLALSIGHNNMSRMDEALAASERAYRFGERLPKRERYLSSAKYHADRGYLDSTAHYYELVLVLDPDNSGAANNLGDALENMGRYEEALERYLSSMEQDPDRWTAYWNAMSAARSLGRFELADSVLSELSERFPGLPFRDPGAALNAYYAGDFARVDSMCREFVGSSTGYVRGKTYLYMAATAASRGQLARSLALSDTARFEFGTAGSEYSIVLVFQTIAAWVAGTPETVVPALDDAAAEPPAETARWEHFRLGMIAYGYALAGQTDRASGMLERMDMLAESGGFHTGAIAEIVRAVIAGQQGDPEASLQHLRQARLDDYGIARIHSRVLEADAYAALERLEEAGAQYDSVLSSYRLNFKDDSFWPPLRPYALRRLGDVYLALGDTTAAIEHFSAFVDMWHDADPELKPLVDDARAKVRTLDGETR
ncbi:MAG: protein kinase [Gemmatimonadetes bacterium]|nr:protein kinase [Gemmatimonadota bacterium]